jgi:hypothetical protein
MVKQLYSGRFGHGLRITWQAGEAGSLSTAIECRRNRSFGIDGGQSNKSTICPAIFRLFLRAYMETSTATLFWVFPPVSRGLAVSALLAARVYTWAAEDAVAVTRLVSINILFVEATQEI